MGCLAWHSLASDSPEEETLGKDAVSSSGISALISESIVLRLLYDRRPDPTRKGLSHWVRRHVILIVVVLAQPLLAFGLASYDRVLFIDPIPRYIARNPGHDPVGLLEDYLALDWMLLTFPALLLILGLVLRRFQTFLEGISRITTGFGREERQALIEKYRKLVTGENWARSAVWKVCGVKWAAFCFAVSSNAYQIYNRQDGWNSSAHLPEFIVCFIGLLLVIYIAIELTSKYLVIMIAQIRITGELAKRGKIEVRPLAPDRSGGLKTLGSLALGFVYYMVPFSLVIVAHYLTWGELTVGLLCGLLAYFPGVVFVFFFPLGAVHKVMREGKEATLRQLSGLHYHVNREILLGLGKRYPDQTTEPSGLAFKHTEQISETHGEAELLERKQEIELLDSMYRKAAAMPVWPFNVRILSRFFSVSLVPYFLVMMQLLLDTGSVFHKKGSFLNRLFSPLFSWLGL